MTTHIRTPTGEVLPLAEYEERERERRNAIAEEHGLTLPQLEMAERAGISAADAARWARVKSATDIQRS